MPIDARRSPGRFPNHDAGASPNGLHRRSSGPRDARPRDAVARLAFRALVLEFALLPRRFCLGLGAAAGSLAYALDRHHRRIALKNLRIAFGDSLDPAAARAIARASFRHFGRMTADVLKLFSLSEERIARLLDVEGAEHLTRALAAGRGAVLVTGHFGNWEIASFAVSRLGPLNVIARRLDSTVLDRELNRLRIRLGARVIDKRRAARLALQALRANEILAILIDQNVLRREGVFVDFFGRPASTTPAAAAFHLRTGAPILPIFCFPAPRGRYRVEIRPPLTTTMRTPPLTTTMRPPAATGAPRAPRAPGRPPLPFPSGPQTVAGSTAGPSSARPLPPPPAAEAPPRPPRPDVLQITGVSTKMLAAEIRRRPDLWLWFHDRWRSRPEPESSSSSIHHDDAARDRQAPRKE